MNIKQFFNEDFIYKALIISLSVHLLFISSPFFIPAYTARDRQLRRVEITYAVSKKVETPLTLAPQPKPEPNPVKPPQKVTAQDALNAAVFIKERNLQPDGLKVYERTPEKNKAFTMTMKKTVSVPLLESEKINNPSYANYYTL